MCVLVSNYKKKPALKVCEVKDPFLESEFVFFYCVTALCMRLRLLEISKSLKGKEETKDKKATKRSRILYCCCSEAFCVPHVLLPHFQLAFPIVYPLCEMFRRLRGDGIGHRHRIEKHNCFLSIHLFTFIDVPLRIIV